MIAGATLPHREWRDFWRKKEESGIHCIVQDEDALVFHQGRVFARFERSDFRDEIENRLAEIPQKEV